MAIQIVNLAVPNGDTPRSANTKINANFSDQNNAASRLVGTASGNVMQVGAFGLGGYTSAYVIDIASAVDVKNNLVAKGSHFFRNNADSPATLQYSSGFFATSADTYFGMTGDYTGNKIRAFCGSNSDTSVVGLDLWHDKNATKDPNGFLKGASPIAEIYSDKMDLNHDATQQGGITFEKLGVGDYLVKGSLGFAQEGWYIETPKDANGNVLVAVVYEQLANNDLSIKTYAKKFDDETGDIVANLLKPRDIPAERFISLRLHELPKEPPVMPTEV